MNYNCIKQTEKKVQETCTHRDIYMPRKLKNTKSEIIICEEKTSEVKNGQTKHYEILNNVPENITLIWVGLLLQTMEAAPECDLYKQKYGIVKTNNFSCASIRRQQFLGWGGRSCPLLSLSVLGLHLAWLDHGDPVLAPIVSVSLYVCNPVLSRRPRYFGLFCSQWLFQSFY